MSRGRTWGYGRVTVRELHRKVAHGKPLAAAARVVVDETAGGLAGDVHADPYSPRQVLLGDVADRGAMTGSTIRLRWNMCLSGLSTGAAPGDVLRFSSGAMIWLSMYCEPCKQLTGICDWARLGPRRGVLGVCLGGGVVTEGDRAEVVGHAPPMSDRPLDRVAHVIKHFAIDDTVLSLPTTLRLAGLQPVYARVMPNYLAEARQRGLDWFRVVKSDGSVFDRFSAEQLRQLDARGLLVDQPDLFLGQGKRIAKVGMPRATWCDHLSSTLAG